MGSEKNPLDRWIEIHLQCARRPFSLCLVEDENIHALSDNFQLQR